MVREEMGKRRMLIDLTPELPSSSLSVEPDAPWVPPGRTVSLFHLPRTLDDTIFHWYGGPGGCTTVISLFLYVLS